MIKTTLNWTVKNLKNMHDAKNTLQMDHVIQRQSGQWDDDRLKKSLLIHSMLSNYPIPPIYCLKEAINDKDYSYSILDGKQRLTTTFDYIDGKYPLDAETPSVVIDDTAYELGNKYFTDLDTECQQELLRFKFTIYGFEDADDDLIEEIFFRLNNSTPLSKPQKAMPLCGVQNAKFIKSILADKFFTEICQFSAQQRRKSDDMCTLLQGMMLLDSRCHGYEYSSISADEIMRYASAIKNTYSEEQKERVFDIIDYLEKVFPGQEKLLKKINIPILMLAAYTAMGDDYNAAKNIYRVGPMYFRQWFYYFFKECYGKYKEYCSSGGIKKEKTLKRIEIMEASLKEYFELEDASAKEDDCAPVSEESPSDENSAYEDAANTDEASSTEDNSYAEESISQIEDASAKEACMEETGTNETGVDETGADEADAPEANGSDGIALQPDEDATAEEFEAAESNSGAADNLTLDDNEASSDDFDTAEISGTEENLTLSEDESSSNDFYTMEGCEDIITQSDEDEPISETEAYEDEASENDASESNNIAAEEYSSDYEITEDAEYSYADDVSEDAEQSA